MKPARTVLEQLIRERRQTFEEFAAYAETYAREHGEVGTLSSRHLQRLAAGRGAHGRPLGSVRPATARLLEHIFGTSIEDLLSPPDVQQAGIEGSELQRLLCASGRVDSDVVMLARSQLSDIRQIDGRLGASVGRQEVMNKALQLESLYRHSLDSAMRKQLGELLCELHTLAGWQALDLANLEQAWWHYEHAKCFGRESDDSSFMAYAMAEQSVVLLEVGEPESAV